MLRVLAALGIGAAAMYFYDPVSGRRRRALARDKLVHYRRELTEVRGFVERRLGQRRPASAVDIDLSQQQ